MKKFGIAGVLLLVASLAGAAQWWQPPGGAAASTKSNDLMLIARDGISQVVSVGQLTTDVSRTIVFGNQTAAARYAAAAGASAARAEAAAAAAAAASHSIVGTVLSVTSANSDIAVNGTVADPVLTLNSGTSAGQIPKRNGSGKLPEAGASNGLATLDGSGKLTASQIPDSLLGAVTYQGVWNAAANSPTLSSGVCTQGDYRKVSVAGSTLINGVSTWNVGDWIICNGSNYDRVANSSDSVLDIAVTAPLVSSGGVAPVISMPAATNSTNGYLPATDRAAFNAKQPALVSGANIKTLNGQSLLGSGDLTAGGITSIGTTTPSTFASGTLLSSSGTTVAAASTVGTGNVVRDTQPWLNQPVLQGAKEAFQAGATCVGSTNINPNDYTVRVISLSGACTIGVTGLGATNSFTLYLNQTSTVAPTFTSAFKWAGGVQPAWSTVAGKYDVVACASPDGVKVICGGIVDAR